jgi:hypothetical protein
VFLLVACDVAVSYLVDFLSVFLHMRVCVDLLLCWPVFVAMLVSGVEVRVRLLS